MSLFVAVWPPPEVVAEMSAQLEQVRTAVAAAPATCALEQDLRWTHQDQWHLTLAFLGEVDRTRQARLEPRLARVAARYPPLRLRFHGGGLLGRRVVYAGVAGEIEHLGRLAASAAAAARRSGVALEARRYRPHLTLARCRATGSVDLKPVSTALAAIETADWTASRIQLVRSRLGAGEGNRSVYEVVTDWPLSG